MTATIMISGMSCQHCVSRVKKAIDALGVTSSDVTIGTASVSYDDTKIAIAAIKKSIEDAGYQVTGIS
ncbi:MAG TPA: cation transporter [Dissulfurispiraceae bacterium]|nr:cation transporter [Dissulfurispiraceae bacterium]